MDSHPLRGLTIVVTRPREQAVQLAQRIEQAGGNPLLFPLLDIKAVPETKQLFEQISRLAQFDLAIFISPNAVRYGVAAIRSAGDIPRPPLRVGGEISEDGRVNGRQLPQSAGFAITSDSASVVGSPSRMASGSISNVSLPPKLKIATVGQGSAKVLLEEGIASVIAPAERFDSEGLLALPELQHVTGWNVMIFRGDGGRELLGDTLKARGAMVEYATCYQRSKPQQNAAELLSAKPDAITVTSSEALGYLWEMLKDKDRSLLRNTPLFLPHARIARLAREQGWQDIHLTGSGDDGLISALIAWRSADG